MAGFLAALVMFFYLTGIGAMELDQAFWDSLYDHDLEKFTLGADFQHGGLVRNELNLEPRNSEGCNEDAIIAQDADNNSGVQCNLCGYREKTLSPRRLAIHREIVHKVCKECEQCFAMANKTSSKWALFKHYKTEHDRCIGIICPKDQCRWIVLFIGQRRSEIALSKHLIKGHRSCPLCLAYCAEDINLYEHLNCCLKNGVEEQKNYAEGIRGLLTRRKTRIRSVKKNNVKWL